MNITYNFEFFFSPECKEEWKKAFYSPTLTLFGDEEEKNSSRIFKEMSNFVTERLKTIFVGVNKNPLILKQNNNPLFLFCFAAGNKKGSPIAVKIADHIIGNQT